jgi:hypothetical protein
MERLWKKDEHKPCDGNGIRLRLADDIFQEEVGLPIPRCGDGVMLQMKVEI